MDEPSTGPHMSNIEKFIGIVENIVDNGNTVVIIEHNMDIIGSADWIIDLGPLYTVWLDNTVGLVVIFT